MARLNSNQIKGKQKILDWAGSNWHKLSEANKTKIYCTMLSKALPTMLEGEGFQSSIINIIRADQASGAEHKTDRVSGQIPLQQ